MAIKISGTTVIDDSRKQVNTRLTTSVIDQDTNATAGTLFYSNTAGVTLTLPSSPTVGDVVGFADTIGDTTSVIDRNNENIMGSAENLTVDVAYASFRLAYIDASTGWAFT